MNVCNISIHINSLLAGLSPEIYGALGIAKKATGNVDMLQADFVVKGTAQGKKKRKKRTSDCSRSHTDNISVKKMNDSTKPRAKGFA